MKEPRWVERRTLLLLHEEILAEHGGLPGLRDPGLLDSALARPKNLFTYNEACDLAELAAAYAFGISQNHPFRDGNKRVAFLSVGLFLGLNNAQLVSSQREAIETFFALAAGKLPEADLAAWIRSRIKPGS
jgi:death on curing protein